MTMCFQEDPANKRIHLGDQDAGADNRTTPQEPLTPPALQAIESLQRQEEPPPSTSTVMKSVRGGVRTHAMTTRSMSRATLGDNSITLSGVLEQQLPAMPPPPAKCVTPLCRIIQIIQSDTSIAKWESLLGSVYPSWDHLSITSKIDKTHSSASWNILANYNAQLYGPLVGCRELTPLKIQYSPMRPIGVISPELMAGLLQADGTVDTRSASTKIGGYFKVSANDALRVADQINAGNVVYSNRTFFAKAFFLLMQSHRAAKMGRAIPAQIPRPPSVDVVDVSSRELFKDHLDMVAGSFRSHELVLQWDYFGQANLQVLPFIYALAASGNPLRPNDEIGDHTLAYEQVLWPAMSFIIWYTGPQAMNIPINVNLTYFNTAACVAWLLNLSSKYQQNGELMISLMMAANLFNSSFVYNHPAPPAPPVLAPQPPPQNQAAAQVAGGEQPQAPPILEPPQAPNPELLDLTARLNHPPPQDVDIVLWLRESLTQLLTTNMRDIYDNWMDALNMAASFEGYADFNEMADLHDALHAAGAARQAEYDALRAKIVSKIAGCSRRRRVPPCVPIFDSPRHAYISPSDLQLTDVKLLPAVGWYNWFWVELAPKGHLQAQESTKEFEAVMAHDFSTVMTAIGVHGALVSACYSTAMASISLTGGDIMRMHRPQDYPKAKYYQLLFNRIFGTGDKTGKYNHLAQWSSTMLWYCFGGSIPRSTFLGENWGAPLCGTVNFRSDEYYGFYFKDTVVERFSTLAIAAFTTSLPQEWGLSLQPVDMNLTHEVLDDQVNQISAGWYSYLGMKDYYLKGFSGEEIAPPPFVQNAYAQAALNALISFQPHAVVPKLGNMQITRANLSVPIIDWKVQIAPATWNLDTELINHTRIIPPFTFLIFHHSDTTLNFPTILDEANPSNWSHLSIAMYKGNALKGTSISIQQPGALCHLSVMAPAQEDFFVSIPDDEDPSTSLEAYSNLPVGALKRPNILNNPTQSKGNEHLNYIGVVGEGPLRVSGNLNIHSLPISGNWCMRCSVVLHNLYSYLLVQNPNLIYTLKTLFIDVTNSILHCSSEDIMNPWKQDHGKIVFSKKYRTIIGKWIGSPLSGDALRGVLRCWDLLSTSITYASLPSRSSLIYTMLPNYVNDSPEAQKTLLTAIRMEYKVFNRARLDSGFNILQVCFILSNNLLDNDRLSPPPEQIDQYWANSSIYSKNAVKAWFLFLINEICYRTDSEPILPQKVNKTGFNQGSDENSVVGDLRFFYYQVVSHQTNAFLFTVDPHLLSVQGTISVHDGIRVQSLIDKLNMFELSNQAQPSPSGTAATAFLSSEDITYLFDYEHAPKHLPKMLAHRMTRVQFHSFLLAQLTGDSGYSPQLPSTKYFECYWHRLSPNNTVPMLKMIKPPPRSALKMLNRIYPCLHTTDSRHMTCKIADLIASCMLVHNDPNYSKLYRELGGIAYNTTFRRLTHILKLWPIGTPMPLVCSSLLTFIGNTVSSHHLDDLVSSDITKYHPSHLYPVLKLHSNVLRKLRMFTFNRPVNDVDMVKLAYWDLSFGRASFTTDWSKERANRCTDTKHLQVQHILDAGDPKARTPDMRKSDPTFYKLLKDKLFYILKQVFPRSHYYANYEEFLDRRNEWLASGSAGNYKLDIEGVQHRVSKRVWAEQVPKKDIIDHLECTPPIEVAVASEKYENGKSRAIYGTDNLHYMHSSYVTFGLEETLHKIEGVEKGTKGLEDIYNEFMRCKMSADKRYHLMMADYTDFNIQHSPRAMATFYEVLYALGHSLGYPPCWLKACHWLKMSKYNMQVYFPMESIPAKARQGMFSGTRSTDLLNTCLNLAYLLVASEVLNRLGLTDPPLDMYHVHQGDDLFVAATSEEWCALVYTVMQSMGLVFQPIKQIFGAGRGEYLRVWYSEGKAMGYLGRGLANYLVKPLQNKVADNPFETAQALSHDMAVLTRRGLDPSTALILHHNSAQYWCTYKMFKQDPQPARIPLSLIWVARSMGGLGYEIPFSSNVQHLCVPIRPYPSFQPSTPHWMSMLPSHMSDDWTSYLVNSCPDMTLDTGALKRSSRATNYSELISKTATTADKRAYKRDIRGWVKQAKVAVQQNGVLMPKIWPTSKGESAVVIDIHALKDQLADDFIKLYNKIHPLRFPSEAEQSLLSTDNVHRHNFWYKIKGPNQSTLASSISRISRDVASSIFKSVDKTRIALNCGTREALSFISSNRKHFDQGDRADWLSLTYDPVFSSLFSTILDSTLHSFNNYSSFVQNNQLLHLINESIADTLASYFIARNQLSCNEESIMNMLNLHICRHLHTHLTLTGDGLRSINY